MPKEHQSVFDCPMFTVNSNIEDMVFLYVVVAAMIALTNGEWTKNVIKYVCKKCSFDFKN